MPTVLAISPHLDDVALSCPGAVLRSVTDGARVVIVSLFTSGPGDELHYEIRQREDRRACAILGAEQRVLGLPDAPYRTSHCDTPSGTLASLFLSETPPLEVARVKRALDAVIAEIAPDQVLGPLGIGNHVDHRIAFDAVRAVGHPNTAYYEDRPYLFVPGADVLRVRALGLESTLLQRCTSKAFLTGMRETAYLRSLLRAPQAGIHNRSAAFHIALRNARELRRIGLAGDSPQRRSFGTSLALDREEMERCLEAVACYESQRDVIGSIDEFASECKRFARRMGIDACAVERITRISE